MLFCLLDPDVVTEAREASVSDNHFIFLKEDVLGVEIFVDDAPGMEVAHRLGHLTTNVDALLKSKWLTPDVEVFVEGTTFAEAVGNGMIVINVSSISLSLSFFLSLSFSPSLPLPLPLSLLPLSLPFSLLPSLPHIHTHTL